MKVLLLLVAILPAALFGVGCTTTKTVNVGTPVALGDFNDPETKHLAGISVVSAEHKTVRSILGLEKLIPNLGLINTLQDNFLVDERSEKDKSLAEVSHTSAASWSNGDVLGAGILGFGVLLHGLVADGPSSSSNSSSSSAANVGGQ